ncbi:MAG: phosphate ABC transporter substrate-binding protein PstS [Oligoflexia bacterium]|nr:phosphate ABC transporter substrate-binding protein PstS [Oligoflexia bacterium]
MPQEALMKLLITLITALSLGSTSIAATLINGAGATFPYPIYSKWFSEYQKVSSEVQINYQSIGSGGGIKQFSDRTVDFGASDAPMTDEQIEKVKGDVLHVPTVLGAVVLTYNLPTLKKELRLTPGVIADIFLGKITKWNDERIKKANPGLELPTSDIMVVRRSDGSGTTNIFTEYLSKISPDWASKVGKGTAVNFPVGLGGKGNEGVTGLVKQTPGAIGYVELIYALNNKLAFADVENKSGQFIKPSTKSVTAAAAEYFKTTKKSEIPEDLRISLTNSAGKGAYPISAFTFILVNKTLPKGKGESIQKFLEWAVSSGQKFAEDLGYAKLPNELTPRVSKMIKGIQVK